MKLSDFNYHLPEELIAQSPIEPRDHSRLLKLEKETWVIEESKFYEILNELNENDVLVLNKTRVINARLHWVIQGSETIVEIFLHKQLSDTSWDCLVYPGKKLKPEKKVDFHLKGIESKETPNLTAENQRSLWVRQKLSSSISEDLSFWKS